MNSILDWNYKYRGSSILLFTTCITFFTVLFLPLDGIRAQATIVLAILFVLFIIAFDQKGSSSANRIVFLLTLFLFQIVLYSLVGKSTAASGYTARYFGWILIGIIGAVMFRAFDLRQRHFLFYCIYAETLIAIIYFIVFSVFSPDNIIAYANYSTMIMIFFGCMLIWFLNSSKKNDKWLALIGLILSVIANLIIFQKAITFFLSIILVLIVVVFRNKSSKAKRIVISLSILLLFLYFSGLYIDLLQWLKDLIGSDRIRERIDWLINGLEKSDLTKAGGSVSGRTQLIEVSFNTWTQSAKNFWIGVGDDGYSRIDLIGGHSDIVDTLAKFGIIGGFLFSAVAISQISFLTKLTSAKPSYKNQCIAVFIIYLLRGALGNIMHPAIALQTFIMLPLVFEICYHNQSKNKGELI